jgi:hypothetical protein
MVRAVRLLPVLACVVITAAGSKFAAAPSLERLKKMSVAVSADRTGGLDQSGMRAAVEAQLRSSGIQIDPKSRFCFNVTVGVCEVPTDPGAQPHYAYSVHVALNQQVYLARNPNIITEAVTWQTMSMRVASADRLQATCAADIARRVDEFLQVYRSVNEQ